MSWNRFIQINEIPKRFHSVNTKYLDQDRVKIGSKWMKSPKSLVIGGDVGRGKTYFALCLIRSLLLRTDIGNVIFKKSKQIDDEILSSIKEFGSASYVIERLKKVEYLFIDDFGVDRSTERTERDYYEILDYRWADIKTTVISTNLDLKQIEVSYGSRILSRLKEFDWIQFNGKDRRGL